MKEFIDKLISSLEVNSYHTTNDDEFYVHVVEWEDIKRIVNELAEEYKEKEVLNMAQVSADYAKSRLEELKRISNNSWIPCSERLPEAGKAVLTCDKDGWVSVNINTPYNGKKNDFECGYYVAWMPLPAPYTEGE